MLTVKTRSTTRDNPPRVTEVKPCTVDGQPYHFVQHRDKEMLAHVKLVLESV